MITVAFFVSADWQKVETPIAIWSLNEPQRLHRIGGA